MPRAVAAAAVSRAKAGEGGGVIDQQRAFAHCLQHAAFALKHHTRIVVIADGKRNRISASRAAAARVSVTVADSPAAASVSRQDFSRSSLPVENGDRMACSNEVQCHRASHHAEPDEADPFRVAHSARLSQSVAGDANLLPHGAIRPSIGQCPPSRCPPPRRPPAPPTPGPDDLTLAHVRAAAERIAGAVVRTPTMHSITLSRIAGAEIYLKFENLQFTAAYKERGALNALLLMDEKRRARGVIAASAGNHSQGLSYHGTRLGVPVTIVMPRTTPAVKVMQTESVGGKVVLEGETFDEA